MTVEQIKLYLSSLDFPWDLTQLPQTAYLVGGSVRDALLQRYKTPIDLDFVLPENAITTAKEIANLYNAGFVVLDREREIARVVFPQGTLDFARQEGKSLAIDLHRRDFTINAIAYNTATEELVDPLGGVTDLQHKILRMISPSNLEDDPLRLLRAYRQAAQLNLTIETETRNTIRVRADLLSKVAAERVQAELNYMLITPQGNQWLMAAAADNLLKFWLPSINQDKVQQLFAVENGIQFIWQRFQQQSPNWLERSILQHKSELSLLSKLATLVATEAHIAEAEVTRLKYSRLQIKTITNTVKHLSSLQTMTQDMSLRAQYFWFLEVKDIFPILMVRAISTGVALDLLEPLIKRYLNPDDPVVYPQTLVSGNDLIQELNLAPSPLIGSLLTEIQVAQIESKIMSYQEALDFAASILENSELGVS